MKKFFRHFLFLILCLSCYTASAGTDDNVGYIVGNSYGVGPSDQKWRETGPNGDATVIFRYATSTNNLVFYKPTQLGPTGVKLQWSQLDTASGGGFLYCNRSDSTSGSAMRIENAMVDSGKMYGSHKLFNTSVPGLYYTLLISNMWSAYGTVTNVSSPGIYIGDSAEQYFSWYNPSEDVLYWSCNNANSTRKYWAVGGIYHPTCFTAMLSGTSVTGSTVKMGEYSAEQIRNGATPVPFDISLQNCVRVTNIETKLVSTKVGTENGQLLGNTLTGNDAAKGVGVLIEGLATSKNPLMTLKPNDSNSVYKDYDPRGKDDTTGGVYPDQDTGITYPLHFQATLQQDGTIPIEAGEFKATSTFQVTYP